jgi:carbamoyltransferase
MTDTGNGVVLGLCSYTHDSAAALVVDGTLVGFAEEERLTGVKHTAAFPDQAVTWLLDYAGLDAAAVDVVGYNFDGRRHLDALPVTDLLAQVPATRDRAQPPGGQLPQGPRPVRSTNGRPAHPLPQRADRADSAHRTHGLYAFASSHYDSAAVLIVDSLGEVQTTTIAHAARRGARCRYTIVEDITDPASLGYAYGAVTEHLGWRRG